MNAPQQGEETIFAEALRLPAEERAAYLTQATKGNAELRQRVESLLGSYQTGDFLEQSAASPLHETRHITVPVTEKAGDTIGRYKLLQQIGEGGCGVVYMAEQAEPVRRRVALKIIKLGMDTKSVIARFEAERQALAMMDHPNIAKVFDAGATEAGRPYFVMELVRGMKITDYCDEAKLPTRARLDLFIRVCQAIQHAHQKGIIHRDIKPSNILVSVNDGVAEPKVIDFGIAKATSGQQLTDKTLFTAFEQFIGTPAYMSPEQAVITNVDIDTRSDIYALGVLLYELLTGKTPFDGKELLAIGLDEMRRTIREQEPQRPSSRLSTLAQNELSTAAQRRGLDAPKLVSELRGDLDWIVMKALEKDRARRYETANGLARDIQRHLSNEPVVACPPSRLYRLQKTVRRNKLAFAAAAAVVAALLVGLGVSTWMFFRERESKARAVAAEKAAKTEKESAEAVLQFVRDKILAAGRPEEMMGGLGIETTLRQAIDAAESEIAKAFTNRPLVEAAIRKTLGESYRYLGEPSLAIPQVERALALRRQELGFEHPPTLDTMRLLAVVYVEAEKIDQAVPLLEETLELSKRKLGPEHSDTLASMNDLAVGYQKAGKLDQAILLLEQTVKLRKAESGLDHRDTLTSMNNLGLAYRNSGRWDKAIPILEEAVKLGKAKRPEHPSTLMAMHNLGLALRDTRQLDRALPLLEEALQLKKAKLGPQHRDTLLTLRELLRAYEYAGKVDQIVTLTRELLNQRTATLGPGHPDTLHAKFLLGRGLVEAAKLQTGDPRRREELASEGERLVREYLADARSCYTNDPLKLAEKLSDVAELRYRQGNYAEAAPLYRETIELRRPRLSADNQGMLEPTASLARLLSDWTWAERTNPQPSTLNSQPSPHERAREAERLLRDVLAVRLRENTNSWRISDVKSRLGAALVSVGATDPALDAQRRETNFAEAESLLLEGYERLQKNSGQEKYLRDAHERIERLYEAWNKPDKLSEWQQKRLTYEAGRLATSVLSLLQQEKFAEAEAPARECLAIREKNIPDHWGTFNARSMLGGSLLGQKKYADAEPLLLSGYDGLKLRQTQIPPLGRPRIRETLERLVQLYEATGRDVQVTEWRQKLAEFDQAMTPKANAEQAEAK